MKEILLNNIRNSVLYTDSSTESEDWINGLQCPACNHKEAFISKKHPYYIGCNRKNQCGVNTLTITYFDTHASVEENFPATPSDPHRPARKYLESRSLPHSLGGLNYKYEANVRGLKRGGILFPLGLDVTGKEVWSGRIFNPPINEGKTHNSGSTSGKYFTHPGTRYDEHTDLYVVEGIFDALSFIEMGFSAIATLSSNADISKMTLPVHKNLIFAYDNDTAGIKATKKGLQLYKNAITILPPKGQDWNDFLMAAGNGEKARELFDAQYDRYRFNADLALTATAKSYVEIFNDYLGYLPELFKFNGRYYSGRATRDGDLYALRVSNFTVETDHFKVMNDPKCTGHVYLYHLIINPQKGRPRKIILEGNELSTSEQIRKALIARGKVLWEGDKVATMALSRMIVDAKYVPVVRQLEVVGYDSVTHGHYFGDFAIDSQGNRQSLNSKGFFKVSVHEYVAPFQYASIKPSEQLVDINRIYNLILASWGTQGAVAVAFTTASWFVEPVKSKLGFFPFLSLYGDTQTGKSRLTRVLNNLQAIDEEGLPLLDTNTKKGGLRKIAQVSGLVKALIEGNSKNNRSFDCSTLLPLYNKGNSLQTTAIKSMDTRTREVPFLGSLMFAQNIEPFKTKAEKERVISVWFSSEQINEMTKNSFDELMRVPAQDLATFIVAVLKHRQKVEKTWEAIFEKKKLPWPILGISGSSKTMP